MQIRELMKESPACILPTDTVETAAQKMKELKCGVLPLCDASGSRVPVGVVTDRDIVLRCIAAGKDPKTMPVSEVCTEKPICCDDDCSAEDAFHTMRERDIGRLLVIDAQGRLEGIVSMADLIARVPAEIWSQLPGAKQPIPRKAA